MPLNPGDPRLKKGGRKGYEIEQAQLEKMRRVLNKDLSLMEKLQNKKTKLTENEEKVMQLTASRVSKIYDKLHATKETREISGGLEISIDPESLDKINKAIDELL